jgi:hypothetical protein
VEHGAHFLILHYPRHTHSSTLDVHNPRPRFHQRLMLTRDALHHPRARLHHRSILTHGALECNRGTHARIHLKSTNSFAPPSFHTSSDSQPGGWLGFTSGIWLGGERFCPRSVSPTGFHFQSTIGLGFNKRVSAFNFNANKTKNHPLSII